MSSSQQTYSPAQYLDAGYRAEMAGEADRAAQYYVYLAECFPETPEGEAARGGLLRLGLGARGAPVDPRREPLRQGASGAASMQPAPHAGDWRHNAQTGGSVSNPNRIQPSSASRAGAQAAFEQVSDNRIRLGELSRMNLGARTAAASAARLSAEAHAPHAHGEDGEPMRLPEVVARRARELAEAEIADRFEPRYRVARLIAVVFTWLGWFVAAGGTALVMLAFVGIPAAAAAPVFGVAGGFVIGAGTLVSGLVLVLGGQVALAIFDNADAMREVKAIMRVRAEF